MYVLVAWRRGGRTTRGQNIIRSGSRQAARGLRLALILRPLFPSAIWAAESVCELIVTAPYARRSNARIRGCRERLRRRLLSCSGVSLRERRLRLSSLQHRGRDA